MRADMAVGLDAQLVCALIASEVREPNSHCAFVLVQWCGVGGKKKSKNFRFEQLDGKTYSRADQRLFSRNR